MGDYSVILFFSNNHAIWTAKLLRKAGIEYKMIPVPRHLSSDCGYCVRIKIEHVSGAKAVMDKNSVEYEKVCAL